MAGSSHAVTFGSSIASGEARITNVGTLNTQIANFTLNSEPSRKQVIPDSTCPFPRDENFIVRKSIFEKLDQILAPSVQYRWAALYGLGGIGKSQIAIEYTYKTREAHQDVWVFWIYANSRETVLQSFRTAVERLDLPGHEDPKANIPKLLEQWLNEESNGEWLMVLDNVDDADILRKPDTDQNISPSGPGRSLLDYIPKRPHGRVLITSRDKTSAFAVVPNRTSLILVGAMDEAESLALLRTRTQVEIKGESAARELVSALELVPLAISQAGSYIHQLGDLYSIDEYLDEFRTSESNSTALLNQQSTELRRDDQAPNSVILAWEISFRLLEKRSTEAVNILCLISALHRQNIPLELVSMPEKIKTRDALKMLRAFSFITVSQSPRKLFGTDERMITVHRLIQTATREWLRLRGNMEGWRIKGLKRVSELFPPSGKYEDWNRCRALLPHADETLKFQFTGDPATGIYRGELIEKLARYDIEIGEYSRALERAIECNRLYRQHSSDNDTLKSQGMSTLAWAYHRLGRWEEAEQIFSQVVEMRKAALGINHDLTISSMSALGLMYHSQSRFDQAEQLELQVLKIWKTKLGANDPVTLKSMNNLATTYSGQGRYEEAEQLYSQVLEALKTGLGEDHPDTLKSMTNLANLYWNQSRYGGAEELYVKVLEARKTQLGASHPDTLRCMDSIALMNWRQGRYDKAEQLQSQALEAWKTKLGAEHPATLESMESLALTYQDLHRYDEAEQLQLQVLETSRTKLGVSHRRTLETMHNLAYTYKYTNRPGEAKMLLHEVVQLSTERFGKDHPETVESREALERWDMRTKS